jgi:hypothetical protein
MESHERQQVVVEHVNVPLSIHCGAFGQEVETSSAHFAGETGPNYDAVQVFLSFHCVPRVVALGTDGPPTETLSVPRWVPIWDGIYSTMIWSLRSGKGTKNALQKKLNKINRKTTFLKVATII